MHLQTFLSIPVTQKCQILSCDTPVANEQYVELSVIQNTFSKNISRNSYFSFFPCITCLCNDCVKTFSSRPRFSGTPITQAKFFPAPETVVMFGGKSCPFQVESNSFKEKGVSTSLHHRNVGTLEWRRGGEI
jgi:hypothetical protein